MGGPEAVPGADYVLFPVPLAMDEARLTALLRRAKPGALLLGGKAPAAAAALGLEWVDCFAREELAVCNAVPTAEGCIGILLARRTRTLWDAPVLVTGYGRVGQAVADRLTALGARVTVGARSPAQRALARSRGGAALPLEGLAAAAPGFDTAVNTIPAPVLTGPVLAALRPGSLIVDLASAPGRHRLCRRRGAGPHRPAGLRAAGAVRPGQRRGLSGTDGAAHHGRKGGGWMNGEHKGSLAFALCGSFCTFEAAVPRRPGWRRWGGRCCPS